MYGQALSPFKWAPLSKLSHCPDKSTIDGLNAKDGAHSDEATTKKNEKKKATRRKKKKKNARDHSE